MSKTGKLSFRLTALCAALVAAYGPAIADEAEVKQLTTPESSVSVGIGNWSNDRPQQGIYDGMRDGKAYGLFDADIVKRDNATGTWLRFSTRDLGLDSRELRGEWLRQGNIGAFIEYSRIPRDNPFTFNTGLQGIGTNRLVVSGTGAANVLPFSQVELGTHRDLTHLGFFKNLMTGLDFKVSFKNEDKEGTRQWGRGGAPEFAVEPIDSTTRQLEALLEYKTERMQLAGGYYGSWYQNDAGGYVDTSVNGGNQSFTTGTLTRFALSLPLDNQAHQAFFNGGYNFTPTTRGTLKLQYSHATQNEHLPTQDIAGLSLAGSPQNLNGELNTTLVQLGLTSRPMPKLFLLANLRYHDSREKTPQARFVQSAGAGTCATNLTCVDNTPLTFKTLSGKAEGSYQLPMQFNLIGGVEVRNQDRTVPVGAGSVDATGVDRQRYVPFRADVDETTYRAEVRRSMSETVNGSLAFLHSKRDGSTYNLTNEAESDEINPIHISDRQRNKWRARLDWMPAEALSLQFTVEDADDNYKPTASRPYGLRDGSAVLYSVDMTYAISDKLQISAWYSYDKTQATQFSQRAVNSGAAAAEKEAHLEDQGNSIGIGLHGRVSTALKLGADLQWSVNKSKYPETITLLGAGTTYPFTGAGATRVDAVGPLPEIENKLTRLKLFATYALQKNSELRFDFIHERWETDDWSWLFANASAFTYGTNTDGTTVTQAPKQIANFVGVRYIYKFQ